MQNLNKYLGIFKMHNFQIASALAICTQKQKKMHCIPKMINGHIMKYVRVQNIHDCKTPLST